MKKNMIRLLLLFILSMLCATTFEVSAMDEEESMKLKRTEFEKISYPYQAKPDRVLKIEKHCNQLKRGMKENDVISLIGDPDLISPVYNTVKGGKEIGSFYYYLLSQDLETGSMREMGMKSITVYFDLEGKLTHAVGKQTSFFKDIKKDTVTP